MLSHRVQRGSVQFLSSYPGDPLTPFTPAYKNSTSRLPRSDPSINIPSIPSLPISYEDALPLLLSLNGKGHKMGPTDAEKKRDSGFKEGGLGYLGVEYWSGPGEGIVEMSNIVDDKITAIWSVSDLLRLMRKGSWTNFFCSSILFFAGILWLSFLECCLMKSLLLAIIMMLGLLVQEVRAVHLPRFCFERISILAQI